MQTYETEVDGGCEQEHEFEIVRCSGHQHVGSRCITLYNADNGEQICKSCPVYGTVEGECRIPSLSCVSALPGRVLRSSSYTCADLKVKLSGTQGVH